MFATKKFLAEAFGTFWLTFGGCGAAVLSAAQPEGGIGMLGVSLSFGLAVLTMAYAFGPISGAHLNPAVTLGAAIAGRIRWSEVVPYMAAQLSGAVSATCLLAFIASGPAGADIASGTMAANGYAAHSPGEYPAATCFVAEFVLTFVFVVTVLSVTRKRRQMGVAPVAIGLALTLIHLISIPITNTSVNPARSTGPALVMYALQQEWALHQLWMFWLAPLAGGALAGWFVPWMFRAGEERTDEGRVKGSSMGSSMGSRTCSRVCEGQVATQRHGSYS
ncbi:Aquaporin Z 2 [compost metagenome]